MPGGLAPQGAGKTRMDPCPKKTITTPLYVNYEAYRLMPKPGDSRAIFVVRDPRDLIVSEYFSLRYSHSPVGDIPEHRSKLNTLSELEGLLYVLEYLHSYGTFACQQSWIDGAAVDDSVCLVHFENLTGKTGLSHWMKITEHFDIQIPTTVLSQLLEDYSFESLAGRQPGVEDKHSHYRKGVHGDWKNYFDERLVNKFKALTGDLVIELGYESDNSW